MGGATHPKVNGVYKPCSPAALLWQLCRLKKHGPGGLERTALWSQAEQAGSEQKQWYIKEGTHDVAIAVEAYVVNPVKIDHYWTIYDFIAVNSNEPRDGLKLQELYNSKFTVSERPPDGCFWLPQANHWKQSVSMLPYHDGTGNFTPESLEVHLI